MPADAAYAELATLSNFSFLEGASHADELVLAARALGLAGLAITDRNSVAGVVRGHLAAQAHGLRFVPGSRLCLTDGAEYLAWPKDRAGWGRLSLLLSHGKMTAPKGECRIGRDDLLAHAEGLALARLAPDALDAGFAQRIRADAATIPGLMLAISPRLLGQDTERLAATGALGVPLLAVNDARMHAPERRPLADVLTAIRLGTTVDALGFAAEPNAERHLKSPAEMARLFGARPDAVANTLRVLEECRFDLTELRYEYPDEITSPGEDPQRVLEARTWEGADWRYPDGVPEDIRKRLLHELRLIAKLAYAPYFLTVFEIVRFARSKDILCQGRGSAANSAVCYVLGITSVDPARHDLLFERFISAARNEPPDIDVDFEHERREEVIQHIYQRYGRDRAGLAATVIHYRGRSAIRDVGKALGLSEDITARIAGNTWGPGSGADLAAQAEGVGLSLDDPRLALTVKLAEELTGFPRHLSQHVGGFVITRGKLTELCPVANAAMADRTTIEWDKDDIEALGILKVDILALGMLTCIRKAFSLLYLHDGLALDLASVPQEDPAVYAMLSRADSLGVFQVESRAQMNMLPRLRPTTFYDLVIEVAIVRPGPIQGDMVHPYLRRKNKQEEVVYPSEELKRVLERTLGVPLFQEQAMKIAIVAAGFTPDEADRLRRAMATFRKIGIIHEFRTKMIEGMAARGYAREFAERCFKQIEGFGTYGFPESHAASFALLVYVSSWLKCHHPAVFACALLNSQPMGFYAPAQIVRDAREHGVTVRPVDINTSDWDCTLEPASGGHALRLGLRLVKGFSQTDATALVMARTVGNGAPFATLEEVARRAELSRGALEALARADAFTGLALPRRTALWQAGGVENGALPLFARVPEDITLEPPANLPRQTTGEEVVEDYASVALSLRDHPCRLLRAKLAAVGSTDTRALTTLAHGARITLGGIVLVRQRPGSAKGVIFITIEDEWGNANLVVFPNVFAAHRPAVIGARLILAEGQVERVDFDGAAGRTPIVHVMTRRVHDRSDLLEQLHLMDAGAGTWDRAMARADEVRSPSHHDPRVTKARQRRYLPGSRDFH